MPATSNKGKPAPKKDKPATKVKVDAAQLKDKLEKAMTFARLALTGKPLIEITTDENGSLNICEGYFGSKKTISGLTYTDVPEALKHHLISEDAAIEAYRYMVKHNMLP